MAAANSRDHPRAGDDGEHSRCCAAARATGDVDVEVAAQALQLAAIGRSASDSRIEREAVTLGGERLRLLRALERGSRGVQAKRLACREGAHGDSVADGRALELRERILGQDGSWAGAASDTCLETLAVLSFIAAKTERIRLLTSVIVIPHRAPVRAAKMISTVDVLSNGRLTLGVGWMAEEIAMLDGPPYARRGAASASATEASTPVKPAEKHARSSISG